MHSLSPEDQPPQQPSVQDRELRRLLDQSLTQQFTDQMMQQDNAMLQLLLSQCDWYITTAANVAMLVIECPNEALNWQVLHQVQPLGTAMKHLSKDAKLRICPPDSSEPFEIRVDELSIYRERAGE
jgi:hypothetical protein